MNKLGNEKSLYLQQHAHNPVNWFPWGSEALNKAKSEDKPILISIGYSSCHWCHVMERESFESEEIAEYLNEHFVAIKVDREERPDLDHIYMEAVQAISGQGGWPLNMFLTPDQKPFYGGTYFPPKPMYGRPSFLQVLHKMQEVFTEQRSELNQKANQLAEAISSDFTKHIESKSIDLIEISAVINRYKEVFEPEFGGFSTAPKFPQPMMLDSLLRLTKEFDSTQSKEMVFKTLDEMAKGGIYDQIGGGFHRYSTDKEWLAPHFEKMLYDNAQLLSTYCNAFRLSQNPYYYSIAEGIYSCLIRDFTVNNEGFGSAWDADSEGEEGLFYIWNPSDFKNLIPQENWEYMKSLVDWTETGNWEGQLIIRLKKIPTETEQSFLKQNWFHLFELRKERIHPIKDSKIVLAWNGLAIQGLFDWYIVSQDSAVKQLILNLINQFIAMRKATGRWERVEGTSAFADDLSSFGIALIRGFQLSGNQEYLVYAEEISDALREEYYNENEFSFSLSNHSTDILHNPKEVFDNAVPSATALCVQFFSELGHLIDDLNLTAIARAVTEKLSTVITKYPTSTSKHVCNMMSLKKGFAELIIVSDSEQSFLKEFSSIYAPHVLYFEIENEQRGWSHFKGKSALEEKATAYYCHDFLCESPTTDVKSLFNRIK